MSSGVLGIDYGSKRIGLAIADKQLKVVKPLAIIANDSNTLLNLGKYCEANSVEQVVVGLPRNMQGEETAQSQEARNFAGRISESLGLPVDLQDESLTTIEAINNAGKKTIHPDSFAAAVILRDYLG